MGGKTGFLRLGHILHWVDVILHRLGVITSTQCYYIDSVLLHQLGVIILHRVDVILHRLGVILHRLGVILHWLDAILNRLGVILHWLGVILHRLGVILHGSSMLYYIDSVLYYIDSVLYYMAACSLAQPDHYFSPRCLSIRDYKRLLEIGSGTLPIGQLWQHLAGMWGVDYAARKGVNKHT